MTLFLLQTIVLQPNILLRSCRFLGMISMLVANSIFIAEKPSAGQWAISGHIQLTLTISCYTWLSLGIPFKCQVSGQKQKQERASYCYLKLFGYLFFFLIRSKKELTLLKKMTDYLKTRLGLMFQTPAQGAYKSEAMFSPS